MNFDLRGLSESNINLFYTAAESVFERLHAEHKEGWLKSNMRCSFQRLLEMRKRIVAGEDPSMLSDHDIELEYNEEKIDLNDIWESA